MGRSSDSTVNVFYFHLFIVFLATVIPTIARSSDDCVYTLYVRTGSIFKGGTDSKMSVTLYDNQGWGIQINNIESWGGLMGKDYDYFERGNLDIFSGRASCLTGPICALNLTSDGSGSHHGWYCNYVEVTSTGAHQTCSQQLFTVEQWLATDTYPYELTAFINNCGSSDLSKIRDPAMINGRDDEAAVSAM
ncbi:PLAT domain-containing protein 3-like [Impatiens glandulifera]|uniref:PLAT domain-containing protein 3-like n=1 Tax=Impatiens glandulifera TaxID=253017 RepID=UPI001FB18D17|nr:PLAT domain-containing protein 3-like [Impatiens glandulifera]